MPFAITPAARNTDLVPALQLRLVLVQDGPDPTSEAALLGLDDVADDLVHAPLSRRGLPGRELRRQAAKKAGVGLA